MNRVLSPQIKENLTIKRKMEILEGTATKHVRGDIEVRKKKS